MSLEDSIRKITGPHDAFSSINLQLPRNYEHDLFKDNWINTLVNTAADRTTHLVINDWGNQAESNIDNWLKQSLVGINIAFLASEIRNDKKRNVGFDIHKIVENIVFDHRGMLVDEASNDTSFTFLSFDGRGANGLNLPRPAILSAKERKDFVSEFLKIKRDKIDTAFEISNTSDLFTDVYKNNLNFAEFIFELFENTNQHGNLGENNEKLKGIRSFTIKRHRFTKESISNKSKNFNELNTYLESFKVHNRMKFFEISIADNGIGIIKRFLASRPDYATEQEFVDLTDLGKLNYIIEKSLSSKLFSGAGKGIKFALDNIRTLEGFATVRTNNIWAYFDGKNAGELTFSGVTPADSHPEVRGTFYNILIPFFT